MPQISYKDELQRKLIHLSSLIIPIIYYIYDKETILTLLIPYCLIVLSVEAFREYIPVLNKLYLLFFSSILREHELKKKKFSLSGASTLLISSVFCIYFFSKETAITAISILIISDTCAALIGRKWGKHKLHTKSYEGTISFIISAICIVIYISSALELSNSFLIAGIVAAFTSAIAELYSKTLKIDDNITIPITISVTISLIKFMLESV